jgi:hypothetical protein
MNERVHCAGRDVREDEVPEYVWEFGEWLTRYCTKQHVHDQPTSDQWLEMSAEAHRRGITFHEDGEIEFRKQ